MRSKRPGISISYKMLEVPVDSLDSALNAIDGGADELQVCSFLDDGGLTPSGGFLDYVNDLVSERSEYCRPKVNVMIRCRGGDDFLYNESEMKVMLSDVFIFKEMGVDGFVFGALTEKRDLDLIKCKEIVDAASPKPVTFSRAFDHVRDFKEAASALIDLGFQRVVTSGLKRHLKESGAIENISFLATKYSRAELSVMPAGGVTNENAGCFINLGCDILQSDCRKAVDVPKPRSHITMGMRKSEPFKYVTDVEIVAKLKQSIEEAVQERDKDLEA